MAGGFCFGLKATARRTSPSWLRRDFRFSIKREPNDRRSGVSATALTARIVSAGCQCAYPGTIVNDCVVLLAWPWAFVAVIVSV